MAANEQFDVFLSYRWQDYDAIKILADKLKAQNLKVYHDRWYLNPKESWPRELERLLASCNSAAICMGRGEMGNWQLREVQCALAHKRTVAEFPIIPILLPGAEPALSLLEFKHWIDLRQGIEQSSWLTVLAAIIRRRPLAQNFLDKIKETSDRLNPYKGLSCFREEDAAFFFGRDDAAKKLTGILARHPFVAVVGASGSGKSSLVRAGLLPRFRRNLQEPWEIMTIVPGDNPLKSLVSALMPLLYPGIDDEKRAVKLTEHVQILEKQPGQFVSWLGIIKKMQPESGRFLLIVDQWEELYGSPLDANEASAPSALIKNDPAAAFIDALLTATEAKALSVVMAVRADFIGRVIGYRPLADRLQNAQINLGPLKRDELQQLIKKPAEKAGADFDVGLVDKMLNDIDASNHQILPLLEFVLQSLWDDPERKGGRMRIQFYEVIQGLDGALSLFADEVYRVLSDADKQIAQKVMIKLVQTGEGVEDCSRRLAINRFGDEALSIIKHLSDERLLSIRKELDEVQPTVTLTHEVLIREWKQFREWLIDDRQFNSWRAKLAFALEKGKFLEKHSLLEARHWQQLKQDILGKDELGLIEKSYQHDLLRKARLAAAVITPLCLVAAFSLWVYTEPLLSPKLGLYVLLTKAGITSMIEPEMVAIPPADALEQENALTFLMGPKPGDKDVDVIELPQHPVSLAQPFRMSRYEITFDQYLVFAYLVDRDGGCPNNHKVETGKVQDENWGQGSRPAVNISWNDATCYAHWLSQKTGADTPYRLPTEAEWEYAARAGTDTAYWWGSDMTKQSAVCDGCDSDWEGKKERRQTAEVDDPGFLPNEWGLYHTHGNVWEWVQDCWHDSYQGAPADGSAWLEANPADCGRHVLRGGSWVDTPVGLRASYRYKLNTYYRYYNIGFRLAQD